MAFVQTTPVGETDNSDPISLVFSGPVSRGNTILVVIAWDKNDDAGVVPVPTDNLGNVYSLVTSVIPIPGASIISQAIWAAPVTNPGSCTISLNTEGAVRGGAAALEYTLLNTANLFDQTANFGIVGSTTGDQTCGPTSLTDTDSELLFSIVGTGSGRGGTGDPTYTTRVTGNIGNAGQLLIQDQQAIVKGTYSAGFTTTGSNVFFSLALYTLRQKAGGGGGGGAANFHNDFQYRF